MTKSNNPPIQKIREGNLEVSIWANQTENGIRYTTDGVIRSYTDKDGKWKNTRSLSQMENLRASRLLDLAFTAIADLKDADREAAKQDQA